MQSTRNYLNVLKAPLLAAAIVMLTAPLSAQAQTWWGFELPDSIFKQLSIIRVREICETKCKEALDEGLDFCHANYPNLSSEWAECVGEYLADYYQCTEKCPPFSSEIRPDLPFGSGG